MRSKIDGVDQGLPADLRLDPTVANARASASSGDVNLYAADLADGAYCTEIVTLGDRGRGVNSKTKRRNGIGSGRMSRRRFRVALVASALLTVATLLVVLATGGRHHAADRAPAGTSTKSYADLVAANFRVLTPRETRRLLGFADALHSCVTSKGIRLGSPQRLNTKIVMGLPPKVERQHLTGVVLSCGESFGGPPPGASLQTFQRSGQEDSVILYLPRQCLLDPKVAGSSRK